MKSALLIAAITIMFFLMPAEAESKFPWQFDKDYIVNYDQGSTNIGIETVRFKKVKHNGKDAYEVQSTLALNVGGQSIKSNASIITMLDAKPIKYVRDFEAAGQKVKVESEFKEGKVSSVISGDTNMTKEDSLPANAYCLDNNMVAAVMLVCTQLKFEVGKKLETQSYFPSVLQTIKLTFDVRTMKNVKIGDKTVECYECLIPEVMATFWITKDGRMVKNEQGPVITQIGLLD